ncbi:MAG: class I SAM-dependent methyltransferase [Planctomycetaceae bacterium]|jgi:SAM-dependent methyltransferase|nr:class I SAM-dependent methyltransferase [Planctomycetaceae bacterium]
MSTTKNKLNLRDFWEKGYESEITPFDIEEPDSWIAELEKQGKIKGRVLDSGCGPGRTALYLSSLGYEVVGMDISNNAIERAKRKSAQKNCSTQFLQADMCTLTDYEEQFDTVVDIGCLHSLFEEQLRRAYAITLHRICRKGATLYIRAFSNANPTGIHDTGHALPALSEEQIRTAFPIDQWNIKDLTHKKIDMLADGKEMSKVFCWFAEIKRKN